MEYVSLLSRVGIPVETRTVPQEELYGRLRDADYDMAVDTWSLDGDGSSLDYFASEAVEGVKHSYAPPGENHVGYDGADHLFALEREAMRMRRPIVRGIQALIYADVPTGVVAYPRILQPYDPEMLGFRRDVRGAVHDRYTYLLAESCP